MGYIEEIQVSDRVRWNNTVKSIEDYDVFYLNEYVDAFMRKNESNCFHFLLYY